MIDTTKSLISSHCPKSFLTGGPCEISRHRRVDNSCNNLDHPHWGAARNIHHRFLPPDYADGISAPRVSSGGFPLPNPRAVSSLLHQDHGFHDHAVTVMLVAWGQFMDHDITLTAETRASLTALYIVNILHWALFRILRLVKHPSVAMEDGTIPTVCPSRYPRVISSILSTRKPA